MIATRWTFHALAALCVAAPPDDGLEPKQDPLPWEVRAHRVLPWHHAAEVPNTETLLMKLVAAQRLAAYSEEWTAEAVAAAPSFDDCLAEARRTGRLLLWYVPHVPGQHMILPHLLDRYATIGLFCDPELVTLITRRFVAVKLPAAGAWAKRNGIAAPDFLEPGLLVLDGEGRPRLRMDRINTFDAGYFHHVLRELAEHHGARSDGQRRAETAWAERSDRANGMALARESLNDGAHAAARAALEGLGDAAGAEGEYLHAILARREHDVGRALAHLDRALALDPDAGLRFDVLVERALLHLRTGGIDRAAKTLDALATLEPAGARAAEAGFLRAAARYASKDEDAAVAAWRATAERFPDAAFGVTSAAYAKRGSDEELGEGPLTRSMADVRWLAKDAYALGPDTQWRRTRDDADDVVRRGMEFLLLAQRSNGSWRGPRWGGGPEEAADSAATEAKTRNENLQIAISAVACAALHAWRERMPDAVDAALARGEEFLLQDDTIERGAAVAWVYADVFRVWHFARRLATLGPERRAEAMDAIARWVDQLVAQQDETGGAFQHFVYRSTFVTAAVTWCLADARELGVDVPERVFPRAAALLESCRGGDAGLYGYLTDDPAVTRSFVGAASRQPLCEWTLFRCGERTPAHLDAAVDLYLEHYHAGTETARKANFHVPSLDHHAGYYFFHNFYPTCRAAKDGADGVADRAGELLDRLCELPEIDGTFIDSGFSYGKSYGTAMALLSMKELMTP